MISWALQLPITNIKVSTMITIKSSSYVRVKNEEEFNIAVKAFVKAGFSLSRNSWICQYVNISGDNAIKVLVSPSCYIYSDNDDGFDYEELRELTIPQLREYLDGHEYAVGDVVEHGMAKQLSKITEVDNKTVTFDSGEFVYLDQITAHYKLQEIKDEN